MDRTARAEVSVMPGKDPIELPALAAQRRGPSAAVCANGHVYGWLVEPDLVASHCPKCGAAVLVACPACHTPLPGDAGMLQWVPYDGNCASCGAAFPWKADCIARLRRTLAEQADVERWSADVAARANALLGDIAADVATGNEVATAVKWLEQQGAESAPATVLEAVDLLGAAPLKQALRPLFPGLF